MAVIAGGTVITGHYAKKIKSLELKKTKQLFHMKEGFFVFFSQKKLAQICISANLHMH